MQTLYQPTPIEIESMIELLNVKHPHATKMFQKAQDIILAGLIYFDSKNDTWGCYSQSGRTSVRDHHKYTITAQGCGCPSYGSRKTGTVIRGRMYCKHTFALLLYQESLMRHLTNRLFGSYGFNSDIHFARAHPSAVLLIDNHNNTAITFKTRTDHIPSSVTQLRWTEQRWRFHTDRDAWRFALWLNEARDIPEQTHIAATQAEDVYIEMRTAGFSTHMASMAADQAVGLEADPHQWEELYGLVREPAF